MKEHTMKNTRNEALTLASKLSSAQKLAQDAMDLLDDIDSHPALLSEEAKALAVIWQKFDRLAEDLENIHDAIVNRATR